MSTSSVDAGPPPAVTAPTRGAEADGAPVRAVGRGAGMSRDEIGAGAGAGAPPHPADAGTWWRPSAPCTPRNCVEPAVRARALPYSVLRVTAVLVLLVGGLVVNLAAAFLPGPLGGRVPPGLVRRWCRWVVGAAGVRVRIHGEVPPDTGVLLVANHVSWLDVPLLAAVRPARMLAKAEIRAWPVAGWLTARGGALFVDRDRIRALPATVARISGALRAGEAVAVFPEGSTWCGRAQGRFRPAVFQAALDAGAPVRPVRLHYRLAGGPAATTPAFVGQDSLLASVWRVASARGLVAEVEVREALVPRGGSDRRALARAAEAAVSPGRPRLRIPAPRRAAPLDSAGEPPAAARGALTA
ncbi:lysophospholipid acyltransferase family protein [Streptomyces sp. NPDC058741]|uniref:lysophospholipid acyltransferase family protein n=1 Tax=Streptomyces sp. NPDC058741 TaxID=3346620 RepID=UPI00369D3BAF